MPPHLIPMIVMAADVREARVVELCADGTAVRTSAHGLLASSNYFNSSLARFEVGEQCPRYHTLLAAADAHPNAMTVEQMQAVLYAARVHGLNMQAVIFQPAAMKMHVSINRLPAAAGPYVPLDLADLFATPPAPPAIPPPTSTTPKTPVPPLPN